MAYDKDRRKLYVDEASDKGAIPLWQIADCLRYNKRDKNGNRNLGMMIKNAKINKWNLDKPFVSSSPNFASDSAKATARKNVYQSLNIPTPQNAGIASTPEWGKMYLGKLAYQALIASSATPNWDYVRPRGVTANYTEYFRALDFDGYEHFAEQPFDTKASLVNHSALTPVAANGDIVTFNRFLTQSIRFFFQMTNGNVKMSLADLFPAEDVKGYHFVVEEYNDVTFGSNAQNEFFNREPDKVHRAEDNLSAIDTNNGYQALQVDIDNTYDGKTCRFVVGANYYSAPTSEYPTNQGKGFIAPREAGYNPFIFSFKVEHYGVLAYKQLQGYYLKAGQTSFTAFDLKNNSDLTFKQNSSDVVGISISLKQHAERYYVVGSNPASGVPANATKFMFKLENQTAQRSVITKFSDETMTSIDAYDWKAIEAGDGWQTIYLRFNGFIKKGERVQFGVLYVSVDNGVTWTTVDKTATQEKYGFEFADDCDDSSVRLFLDGTI